MPRPHLIEGILVSSYPPPAQQGMTANSLFSGLFDIKFTRFVTVKIISIIYTLALVLLSVGLLGMVLCGFSQGARIGSGGPHRGEPLLVLPRDVPPHRP